MRWLSLLSFQTGEVAYRLKWVHPQPSAAGTSRMFLAGQHQSFWWMAETRRHDIITTRLGIGAFYAEQAAESATSQHCPVNTPELPQPRGMEQMLRWLGALRTVHDLHGAYAETIATLLEVMMQYSFCHLALMALAKAAAEPDPTGLIVRGAYTNVVSNSLFLYGHRLMLMGAKGVHHRLPCCHSRSAASLVPASDDSTRARVQECLLPSSLTRRCATRCASTKRRFSGQKPPPLAQCGRCIPQRRLST